MSVSERQLKLLAPYLEGTSPTHSNEDKDTGEITREWNLRCPLHEDEKRSASLNIDKGVFHCFLCGGMSVTTLLSRKDEWVNGYDHETGKVLNLNGGGQARPRRQLTDSLVSGWHSSLDSNPSMLQWLQERRGINLQTVQKYEIGWDRDRRVFTIPIRSYEGELWNVRYYDPDPGDERRKIYSESGYGSPPRLYPLSVFADKPEAIIIGGGEWDILLTLQNGFAAITRTAGENTWSAEWGQWFKDRIVYVCHDRDAEGKRADVRVATALRHVAADVRKIVLPYPIVAKHGQDLTDFLLEHTPDDLRELMATAIPLRRASGSRSSDETVPADDADGALNRDGSSPELTPQTVLEANDAKNIGKPMKLIVTIKGRKEPGYTIPHRVNLVCSQDAGNKCNICPMRAVNGDVHFEIAPDDPHVLSLIDTTNSRVSQSIAETFGVPGGKCNKLQQEIEEHQSVEILYGRPALDYSDGSETDPDKAATYKTVKITSVGRHDTPANNTVQVIGALQPNPNTQGNEFLVHNLETLGTSVDSFSNDEHDQQLMRRFESKQPLHKIAEINKNLAEHVTRIHGRPHMHALIDLTYHSVLNFIFAGERVDRGWLESLIVGDTRTGKSLAAQRLVKHFGAGEIISCEAASFAGVVGGLQTIGQKDWVVTWGVIPINDRRLVVLDEIGGLSYEEIAQMSDIRSSGQAKLIKIQQETTWARTRLLWLGNPRNATMANFTYGVDAIKPLIGNAEDIARFDLAMAVTMFDVPSETINQSVSGGELVYTSEACHTLLMWVWTRTAEQILWTAGAEDRVFYHANDLGKQYIEEPPLIQAANIRIKIARLAVSIAARTHSTDSKGECVMVTPAHVDAAVRFINMLYGMDSFGYRERSRERLGDRLVAEQKKDEIREYLLGRPLLIKFLRGAGKFRRQDLDEILSVTREESNGIISRLYEARMVRKVLGDIVVEPTLHTLLREMR